MSTQKYYDDATTNALQCMQNNNCAVQDLIEKFISFAASDAIQYFVKILLRTLLAAL